MTQDPIYEAIALLTVRAGMIMEDGAAEAVSALPAEAIQLERRLYRLKTAAEDALALINAADAIRRRGDA
jgi:hypothetical protein